MGLMTAMPAQNLVVNGSFEECGNPEEISGLSGTILSLDVPGWSDPSGTSDRYHFRASRWTGQKIAPMPDSGIGFGGFWGCHHGCGACEYIQGSTSKPLEKGVTYCFSIAIYVNGDYGDERVISSLGVCFSEEPKLKIAPICEPLTFEPQLRLNREKKILRHDRWPLYYAFYTAQGGERNFILGTFKKKGDGCNDNAGYKRTYFYIDNVSITGKGPPERDPLNKPIVTVSADTSIAPGKTLQPTAAYFAKNDAVLLTEYYSPVYKIAEAMKLQPTLMVEITAYASTKTTKAENQALADDRARAIGNQLLMYGVPASRIRLVGIVPENKTLDGKIEFVFSKIP
jgi:outer membrane protein OmpA-like peptidoglycan-associated protein